MCCCIILIMVDQIYERHGEYIRNPSQYFVDRCLGDYDATDGRDFAAIIHDLQHGYDGSMSLTALVHRFVGADAKVTQKHVLAAIRAGFAQLYESKNTYIDKPYSDARNMFDMLLACHPKFDTKFRSYLPDAYELDKDEHGYWTVTVIGRKEHIVYIDGEYYVLDSEEVVDDLSWVKTARNAVKIFKGCTAHEAGFANAPALGVVRTDAIDALRRAIDDQIGQYRGKHKAAHNGKYVDEVDGKVLSPSQSHVDHYPVSFARLVDTWLAEQQCTLEDVVVEATVGDFGGVVMCDDAQRRSWQDYHRRYATLRVVSKERNLSSRHY